MVSAVHILAALLCVFQNAIASTTVTNGTWTCPNPPRVTVKQGTLRGKCVQEAVEYTSFYGIPYAKTPIAARRFRGPEPPESFSGEHDATFARKECPQVANDGQARGVEDCLYLNVHTPRLGKDGPALPVVFQIHGGGYQNGSGSGFPAGSFVRNGVILVTINHRLNVFGFLNLNEDFAPGNAGLKDLIMGLKWVNQNIAAFGGDPGKVIICGVSAGAASVHWLSILPQTKGLFRGAIMMGGSALATWAYSRVPRDYNRPLLQALRAEMPSTASDQDLLQKATVEQLIQAHRAALDHRNKRRPGTSIEFGPSPSLELSGESLLVTQDPESLTLRPSNVPMIVGITQCEWAKFAEAYDSKLDEYLKNFTQFIPSSIFPESDTRRALHLVETKFGIKNFSDVNSDIIKQFYSRGNTIHRMHEYMADVFIKVDVVRAMRLQSRTNKVYAYRFELPAVANESCAYHGDDQQYLAARAYDYDGNSTGSRTVRRLALMWTNFAKYLNPVPEMDSELLTVKWEPMKASGTDSFLQISETLSLKSEDILGEKDGLFWKNLYIKYREGQSI